MTDVELLVDLPQLEDLAPAWDRLAVQSAEPQSSPSWMLAWWRHGAPLGAELRVAAIHDHGELIGVVPCYLEPARMGRGRRYRLLADDFSASVTPLARPDRAWDVAAAAAGALASTESSPAAFALGPLAASSPWPMALRERWPGRLRPLAYRRDLQAVPVVSLREPSFDAWLAARSARFRSNTRRYRRLFEGAGGTERLSTAETVKADVEAFARLHTARWQGIGVSRLAALGERLPLLLEDLAGALLAEERFRLLMLEIDGEPICADLWIAAGGEVVGVNIGWDERFKHLSAPRLSFLRMIEEGFRRGEDRMNLGWGRLDYKRGFANGRDAVAWEVLLPPGPWLGPALVGAVPTVASRRARQSAKRMLAPEQVEQLRVLRRRLARD